MIALERVFALDHPAAQGHFPGNPIIPGAVLLNETLQAVAERLGISLLPVHLAAAKFLAPARPGDRVRIEISQSVPGAIRFACSVGRTTVLTGMVTCEPISTPA